MGDRPQQRSARRARFVHSFEVDARRSEVVGANDVTKVPRGQSPELATQQVLAFGPDGKRIEDRAIGSRRLVRAERARRTVAVASAAQARGAGVSCDAARLPCRSAKGPEPVHDGVPVRLSCLARRPAGIGPIDRQELNPGLPDVTVWSGRDLRPVAHRRAGRDFRTRGLSPPSAPPLARLQA